MLFKVVHVCLSLMYTLKRRCVVGLFLHTYIRTYIRTQKFPSFVLKESNDEMKNVKRKLPLIFNRRKR